MKLNGEGKREEEENKLQGNEEVEEVEVEEEEVEESGVKWAHHYSSIHRILLVGDGDFSFSLSLANAFGSASNIVATSLDSHETLLKKYSKAESNLERLKEMGATVLHDVDATKMKLHADLKMQKFDRIIYNFPHAGFIGKEDNILVIKIHMELVNGFFKNASHMLRPDGEVHVSHKIGDPFNRWNIVEVAVRNSLILTECVNFSVEDYPGYNNKRGDGHRSDQPFPLGECRTFKFRIRNIQKKNRAELMLDIVCGRSFAETAASNPSLFGGMFRGNPLAPAVYPRERWDRRNFHFDMGDVFRSGHPPTSGIDNNYLGKSRSPILCVCQASSIEDPLRKYRPYMVEAPRNTEIVSQIEDPLRKYRPYMVEAPQNNEIVSQIEDPLRKYRPYMIEAPRNTEIGYSNQWEWFHHPTVSRPRLPQDLPGKYDVEEEIIMRIRMKTNCWSRQCGG